MVDLQSRLPLNATPESLASAMHVGNIESMKRLGLVGGTTWHSTAMYYKLLNEGIQSALGGVSSADLLLASLNFAEVARNNEANDWDANEKLVCAAALGLKAGGAKGLLLCANTMHLLADAVARETALPIIHVADATAAVCKTNGYREVLLLGTRFTMEQDFFRDRLSSAGISWTIPSDEDRGFIHASIFDELAKGQFSEDLRARYVRLIDASTADAVILGCTELPILIRAYDVRIPTLDTTAIHVDAGLEFMVGGCV
jgi:aspartate racemase